MNQFNKNSSHPNLCRGSDSIEQVTMLCISWIMVVSDIYQHGNLIKNLVFAVQNEKKNSKKSVIPIEIEVFCTKPEYFERKSSFLFKVRLFGLVS